MVAGKKMHILMLSMPLRSVIFFSSLHTNITDLKHDDELEEERRNERQGKISGRR